MKEAGIIGQRHGALLDDLLGEFDIVRSVADREFIPMIDQERGKLRAWRARIAGIGQVKAGKSTFLSALVRKPGFLPSEVNPWTAVVTNLYCGHPDDPTEGGVFHFFAEEDWLRIIEGDAKTRELAKELLPGFDPETLRQQVETMRARAKQRLGNFYSVLLGSSHTYDRITREMLERYVCAGTEFETSSDRTGRYSDITERADIYLPQGQWAVPTVVTDTPGVNDPFLVRDEFTCRSLVNSDIFILMLSVHQALTDVDLALVRMVSEHPDKRILVVINRIDELEEFAEKVPQITKDVAKRLSAAGLSIPDDDIVPASAAWAEMLLNEDPASKRFVEAASSSEVDKYLKQQNGSVPDNPGTRLWVASGMAKVSEAIDRAVTEGAGSRILEDRSEVLISLIKNIQSQLESSRTKAVDFRSSADSEGAFPASAKEVIEIHAAEADHLSEDLTNRFAQGEKSLDELVDMSWRATRREMDLSVVEFIDRQSGDLKSVVKGESEQTTFDLGTVLLREKLEETARSGYDVARQNLDQRLAMINDEIQQITSRFFGAESFDAGLTTLPHETVLLIAAETPRTLTLELVAERGWRFWANSRLNEDEALAALKQIIRAEFYPVVETLTGLVHDALVERAFEALTRVKTMTSAMIESAKQRAAQLSPSSEELEQHEILTRIDEGIRQIDEKLAVLAQAQKRLTAATKEAPGGVAKSA